MPTTKKFITILVTIAILCGYSFAGDAITTPTPAPSPTPSPTRIPSQYPLKISGRFLADQHNVPFLMVADSPWSAAWALPVAGSNSFTTYVAARAAQGFNTIVLQAVNFNSSPGNQKTYDGIAPFTGKVSGYADLSTPNAAYWSRLQAMISVAQNYNMVVFLIGMDASGTSNLPTLVANGPTKCFNFGVFLANTFPASVYPNVVWNHGNDYNEAQATAAQDACVQAVCKGIKSVDALRLQTCEISNGNTWFTQGGSTLDFGSITFNNSPWSALVNFNLVYSYPLPYDADLRAYADSPTMPSVFFEGGYEGAISGPPHNDVLSSGTVDNLRKVSWWNATTGQCGQFYGHAKVSGFPSGWANYLNAPGAIQFTALANFLRSINWQNLVPSANPGLMTSGYGTYATGGYIESSNYATAALATDGSLALIYTPVTQTLTVDLTKFSGPVNAYMIDPATCAKIPVSRSPFPNAGTQTFNPGKNNSVGGSDWGLLLIAASTPTPTPGAARRSEGR